MSLKNMINNMFRNENIYSKISKKTDIKQSFIALLSVKQIAIICSFKKLLLYLNGINCYM